MIHGLEIKKRKSMANGHKKSKDEFPEPGFLEQANALVDKSYAVKIDDPQYGHGLLPRDHKLLVNIMDLHENYIDSKIIDKFTAKIAEHYDPIMAAIGRLELQQTTLVTSIEDLKKEILELTKLHIKDMSLINERFIVDESQIAVIHERLAVKKERIHQLEEKTVDHTGRLLWIEGVLESVKNVEKAAAIVVTFDSRLMRVEKHTNIYWEFIRNFLIVSGITFATMYGHTKGWW